MKQIFQKTEINYIILFIGLAIIGQGCKEDITSPDPLPSPPTCKISLKNYSAPYMYPDTVKLYIEAINFKSIIDTMYLYVNDEERLLNSHNNKFEYKLLPNEVIYGVNKIRFKAIDDHGNVGDNEAQFQYISTFPGIRTDTLFINTDNSVQIKGKLLSTGGLPTTWGVCFSEEPMPLKDTNYMTEDTLFSFNLKEELDFGKKYYIRIWAENSNGVSYGEEYEVVIHNYGRIVDPRDGKEYRIIDIEGNIWMAENLAWEGDGINVKNIIDSEIWYYNMNGYAYYFNDKEKYGNYGILYQFDAAKSACPSGWRLPTPNDWDMLAQSVGGRVNAGVWLKSSEGWLNDGNGEDRIGFNSLPVGFRQNDGSWGGWDGSTFFGKYAMFWTNEELDNFASLNYFSYDNNDFLYSYNQVVKSRGVSVRCVKE